MKKPPPNRIVEWREKRGWKQVDLARAAGVERMQIHRLESGKTKLKADWALKLSKVLECEPSDLYGLPSLPHAEKAYEIAGSGAPEVQLPFPGAIPVKYGARDLPIMGLAMGGDGHYHLTGDTVDWTWRPPELIGVQGAFALFTTGDSMEDAVMEGAILLVHPHQPVRPRDLCVLELTDGAVLVKRLLRRTAAEYLVRQYNPPLDYAIATASVMRCLRVVGQQFP